MGLVFVLLLGEIDLSAGYTGGTAAAVTGVVMTEHGWPWIPSLIAGLLTGAVIGTDHRPAGRQARASRRSWSPWRSSSACRA